MNDAQYITEHMTETALAAIRATEFWSNQWSNYRADSDEAMALLAIMGYEIDGDGEDTGLEAMTGFYADDSGFRSSNLDYAKSYSGYRANKGKITVMTPAMAEAKKMKKNEKIKEEILENEKNLKNYQEKMVNYQPDQWSVDYLTRMQARTAENECTVINGRKYHAEYDGKKFETMEGAIALFEQSKIHKIASAESDIQLDRERAMKNYQDSIDFCLKQIAKLKKEIK